MKTSPSPRVLVAGALLAQPMGGVRRHSAELLPRAARLLEAGGGGLALLAGREGLALGELAGVEVLESRVPAGPPLARALKETRALRSTLARASRASQPFDLVHTAHLPAPGRLPVPFTLLLHDLRRLAPPGPHPLAHAVLARAVARAEATLTVSATVRDQVERAFHPRQTFVVPNGCDHLPRLERAAPAAATLLHVGHLESRKNLELLLRALAHDAELPTLELAGAPKGDARARLEGLARKLGVTARVRFLGAVSDAELPELYARCAAAVFPSRLEGFGIGVLEALRAGAPVAIARAGALPEVAGPDVPSFAPDDPIECAGAIRAAIARSPAQAAAQVVRAAKFTWDRGAEALVHAWTSAAGL